MIGCRSDLVGWWRERVAKLPSPDVRDVVVEVPDWICEVISASRASVDTGRKREAYQRSGVAFYWLVDPERRTLTVLRRTDDGYVIVAVFLPGERVRAAPFEGMEFEMDEIFVDDEEASAE